MHSRICIIEQWRQFVFNLPVFLSINSTSISIQLAMRWRWVILIFSKNQHWPLPIIYSYILENLLHAVNKPSEIEAMRHRIDQSSTKRYKSQNIRGIYAHASFHSGWNNSNIIIIHTMRAVSVHSKPQMHT